jgi:hypothetical protein
MAQVMVSEGGSSTSHVVAVSRAGYDRLSGGRLFPDMLVRRTFEFLLAREPKESILRSSELSAVGRYFPDLERPCRAIGEPVRPTPVRLAYKSRALARPFAAAACFPSLVTSSALSRCASAMNAVSWTPIRRLMESRTASFKTTSSGGT